jgi:hypothetical protein
LRNRFLQKRGGSACSSYRSSAEPRHNIGAICKEKLTTVMLHSVFLRSGCCLPDQLRVPQESIGDDWAKVADIEAPALDAMIRHAGWHFMWMLGSYSRKGFGRTPRSATDRALAHALKRVARHFNAAELEAARVAKYLGFYIATVTLQPRQIQHYTALDHAGESRAQMAQAR